jgi:hypothetical protein
MSRREIRVERRLGVPNLNSAETAVAKRDPRCTANVVRDSSDGRYADFFNLIISFAPRLVLHLRSQKLKMSAIHYSSNSFAGVRSTFRPFIYSISVIRQS